MTQPNQNGSLQVRLQLFKTAFEALVPRNPRLLYKKPIFLAIQAKLRRSSLCDKISPLDILYDVWLQGVQAIKRGQTIHKLDGWIYTVALRIIAKKITKIGQNRKNAIIAHDSAIEKYFAQNNGETITQSEVIELQYEQLNQAIKQLSKPDIEILEFTLLDHWSYADIADYQTRQGHPSVKLSALRQQKSRAMKKLRKLYYQQ